MRRHPLIAAAELRMLDAATLHEKALDELRAAKRLLAQHPDMARYRAGRSDAPARERQSVASWLWERCVDLHDHPDAGWAMLRSDVATAAKDLARFIRDDDRDRRRLARKRAKEEKQARALTAALDRFEGSKRRLREALAGARGEVRR